MILGAEVARLAKRLATEGHDVPEILEACREENQKLDRPMSEDTIHEFVNQFVGTTNLLPGTVVRTDGSDSEIRLDSGTTLRIPAAFGFKPMTRVVVSVRPERFSFASTERPGRLTGTVAMVMPLGPSTICKVDLSDGTSVKVVVPRTIGGATLREGQTVFFELASPEACCVFRHP